MPDSLARLDVRLWPPIAWRVSSALHVSLLWIGTLECENLAAHRVARQLCISHRFGILESSRWTHRAAACRSCLRDLGLTPCALPVLHPSWYPTVSCRTYRLLSILLSAVLLAAARRQLLVAARLRRRAARCLACALPVVVRPGGLHLVGECRGGPARLDHPRVPHGVLGSGEVLRGGLWALGPSERCIGIGERRVLSDVRAACGSGRGKGTGGKRTADRRPLTIQPDGCRTEISFALFSDRVRVAALFVSASPVAIAVLRLCLHSA